MTKDGYISPKFLKTIKDKYQYIIVDEISMIPKDLWKRLCEPSTKRNICFLNRTRIIINKYWNEIYEGMPVIAKITKRDGDKLLFANSEMFNVGNIDDEYISVYCERPDENGEKEVYVYDCPIEEFRDYFLMNYIALPLIKVKAKLSQRIILYTTGNI
jgi:predicted Zn-ribbon and HTH transcriptional regulator